MPPEAGHVIAGRYLLEEPAGHGDRGDAWRAHDRLLDRKVAVQETSLPSAIGEDAAADLRERTRRAAQAAARFRHRNIVTVYDAVEEDGRLWLVTELVPSRSLAGLLASSGPLTVPRAARIGQQLLAALMAAHDEGLPHGDIRPANVLIASDGLGDDQDERAMLADFGPAQPAGESRLSADRTATGAAGFTAPERRRGEDATPAADLWSLGATLDAAVAEPGPLAPLIDALMSDERAARPSVTAAAAMFAEILAPARASAPGPPAPAGEVFREFAWETAGSPGSASPRDPNSPRRRRAVALTARVMLVIVALVVGGYLFRQSQASGNLSDPAPANPPGSAPASPTAPASSPNPATPTTSATRTLPPVATAPAIVQAIDTANVAPPLGYSVEGFSAAQLGATAGFTIALPPGWRSVPSKQDVKLTGPGGSFVEINLMPHVKTDMVSEAEYLRTLRRTDFPGYQQIYGPPDLPRRTYLQPVAIRRTPGALLEFDWVPESSIELREDVLLFTLGQQSYTIYAAGPAGRHDRTWNRETLKIVSSMLRTFTPALS